MMLAHSGSDSPLSPHLHPDVVAVVALVALSYRLALTRLGPRRVPPDQQPYTRRQATLLTVGVVVLWLFSDWPIHDLSEGYLYSVHMIQHSVYTLALPPLFILGTPPWLWRWLLGPVLGLFRQLVRPAVAVILFSAVTVLTHLPVSVTAAVRSGPAHVAQHAALVLAGVAVWWPLLSPLPELARLAAPAPRVVYLFSQMLVPSMIGSALIWARAVPYRVYEDYPRLWGIAALDDQRWAGAIMELAEGGVLFGLMLVVLVRMAREALSATRPAPGTRPDRRQP